MFGQLLARYACEVADADLPIAQAYFSSTTANIAFHGPKVGQIAKYQHFHEISDHLSLRLVSTDMSKPRKRPKGSPWIPRVCACLFLRRLAPLVHHVDLPV